MSGPSEHERVFEVFGTEVKLLVGPPMDAGLPAPAVISLQLEGLMRAMHRRMTRFDPGSELSRLNGESRAEVEVSPLLMAGLAAALEAAQLTGGLVDPTLAGPLEAAGYGHSRRGAEPAPLERAVSAAPERVPARPAPDAAWRSFELLPGEGTVARPPGLRIELGGSAKGLAADLAGAQLERYASFAVDVGGDLRVGGASTAPREVHIAHPFDAGAAHRFRVRSGAVATSGIATRVWAWGDGYAHHLIDPATGRPAWTGLVQATALAPTAVEAEALAKAAFLSGPGVETRRVLGTYGGLVVADDGTVEPIGARDVVTGPVAVAA